jgi:hypothetical protein
MRSKGVSVYWDNGVCMTTKYGPEVATAWKGALETVEVGFTRHLQGYGLNFWDVEDHMRRIPKIELSYPPKPVRIDQPEAELWASVARANHSLLIYRQADGVLFDVFAGYRCRSLFTIKKAETVLDRFVQRMIGLDSNLKLESR